MIKKYICTECLLILGCMLSVVMARDTSRAICSDSAAIGGAELASELYFIALQNEGLLLSTFFS